MNARTVVAAAGVVLLAACIGDTPSPVSPAPSAPTLSPTSLTSTMIVDGSIGPGSLYRLSRPANWNGDLVIYAHGFVSPDQPVALPPEAELFISLFGAQGFAVAFSSFSENGWVINDGAQRTHQLLGVFTSKFGKPNRVYLGGASMGGLIAIKLAETHPGDYAGVLAACSAAGGTQRLFDYHAHVRALFDYFYPGVLPGSAVFLPGGTDIDVQIIAAAVAAMTTNPTPATFIAAMNQTPLPFADGAELAQSIVTALVGNASDLANELANGKTYFDNQTTVYSSAFVPPALLQAINVGVQRFSASPAALASFAHNYTPSGALRMPMLMLSNSRDPVIPGFNQSSYLAEVTANGASNLLVQRQVDVYGHCVFQPTEIGAAFSDLVLWVQFAIKPAP